MYFALMIGPRFPTIPVATLVLALITLPSCASRKGPAGFQMPPMPVEVAEVRPQTVRDQFRALGSIESDEIVQVVSELNATGARISFPEGEPVAKGALLAQLDDREFRAEAMRAEAQRELAEANAQRAERLFEQQVISPQQRDDARTELKVAEANEALAKARLAKTSITAPFGGLVGRRHVSPGAYLKSGDAITELARVEEMKVTFAAPERHISEIQRGRQVDVTTPAYPGQVFEGLVSVVDPIVDPETRTVQLVARVPNPDRKLRPGMSANVSVTFAERTNALTVPDEAVFAEGSQSFVYVVNPDNTVARAAVELGTRDSASAEVVRGLAAGARVVRAGHQKLFPGAKVVPVQEQASIGADSARAVTPDAVGAAPGGTPSAAGAAATRGTGGATGAKAAPRGTRPKGKP